MSASARHVARALILPSVCALAACDGHEEHYAFLARSPAAPARAAAEGATTPGHGPVSASDYPVPPPPFTDGIFPCMDCHAETLPDETPRELSTHEEIRLAHGDRARWCYDCHNPADRDRLRLASGQLVPFAESYRLCGQCHGDKYRDWRVGVHGRRTGEWGGRKQYLLCIHCHNPHSPKFKPVKPLPPPLPPSEIGQGARTTAAGRGEPS